MNNKRYIASTILTLLLSSSLARASEFDTWRKRQVEVSVDKIFESMSQSDTVRGVVVASPSKSYPDYYYHWIRDAGLVMDTVIDFYVQKNTIYTQQYIENKINDYIVFSKDNQQTQTLTGLGEPKFYVDGASFGLSWGRPQTDGPALRALALIRWANIKLDEGEDGYVKSKLYLPSDFQSVIKADLEYVSYNWKLASFDLWEEESADHFFTKMVQRAALIEGAALAQRLNDLGASDWYLKQASAITAHLKTFVRTDAPYIPVSLNHAEGLHAKTSGLDVAVILAVLRTPETKSFISIENVQVQKTLKALISQFKRIYPINHQNIAVGTAIGRYPEDVYDGVGMSRANPWVLATMAAAETYYKLSLDHSQNGRRFEASKAFDEGDLFYKRVQFHANPDHSLSEQMDRESGHMVGARDLTWSYSSVLKAEQARELALKLIVK